MKKVILIMLAMLWVMILQRCVGAVGSEGDRTLTGKVPLQVRAVLATLGRPIA